MRKRSFKDRSISTARAMWYSATEPGRLAHARVADHRMQSHEPLVSIIIPTHNRVGLLLDRALPSIVAQTYKNIEVIIACHGCMDDTDFYAARYLRDNGVFKVRAFNVARKLHYPDTPENRWFAGPVDPINAGLTAASGAYIARLDDDDTWEPRHLTRCVNWLQSSSDEFISAGHVTHKGRVEPYRHPNLIGDDTLIGGTQTWVYRSYLKLFRYNRDCWRKEHNRVNDTDIQDRMVKAGVKMAYTPVIHANVLPRPGETTVGLNAVLEGQSHENQYKP